VYYAHKSPVGLKKRGSSQKKFPVLKGSQNATRGREAISQVSRDINWTIFLYFGIFLVKNLIKKQILWVKSTAAYFFRFN